MVGLNTLCLEANAYFGTQDPSFARCSDSPEVPSTQLWLISMQIEDVPCVGGGGRTLKDEACAGKFEYIKMTICLKLNMNDLGKVSVIWYECTNSNSFMSIKLIK